MWNGGKLGGVTEGLESEVRVNQSQTRNHKEAVHQDVTPGSAVCRLH